LDKAIELNPDYGNAKYFYGAECSANAFVAMQNYDLENIKYFYKIAYEKGAYPDWLVESGENMLNSCDTNSILFTGGNVDFDVCSYLQLIKNYRKDITIIPIGNIDRPWYIKFLKQGLDGGVKKINLNMTDNQIYNIHPFKWNSTKIKIPVSESVLDKYNCKENYEMLWTVNPDLKSNRKDSKIQGEEIKYRTYLSPQRAMLLQIIEDNFQSRPVYFSNLSNPVFFGGANEYFKNCGLVSELTPIKTEGTEFENDYKKIDILLKREHFKYFSKITTSNIPRISGNIAFSYYGPVWLLANFYSSTRTMEKLSELKNFFKNYLAVGFNGKREEMLLRGIERLEKKK